MFELGRLQIIGLGILAGAILFGAALWRAYEAGEASAMGQQAVEDIDAIRKAKDAADRARLRELEPGWVPDDQWRRD